MKRIRPILLILFLVAFIAIFQHDPLVYPKKEGNEQSPAVASLPASESTKISEVAPPQQPAVLLRQHAPPQKELTILPAPEFEGPAITIEVWNRTAKQPLPYARVLLDLKREKGSPPTNGNDFRAQLIQNGEIYRCDENGQLQAPRTWLRRWAGAEAKGLWGTAFLVESELRTTVRIEVDVDRSLVVEVVDDDGRPQADVKVQLVLANYGVLGTLLETRSDSQGIATLQHVNNPSLHSRGAEGYAILVGDPPPPPGLVLQPLASLPSLSKIAIAPTTRLELTLLGLDGTPLQGSQRVSLRLAEVGQDPLHESRTQVFTKTMESQGSLCVFPAVAAGHPLRLQVDFDGIGDLETFSLEPMAAGEMRKIELQQQRDYPTLTFRAVDADGKALTNQKINFIVKGDLQFNPGAFLQQASLITDSEGHGFFRLAQPKMEKENVMIHSRKLTASASVADSEKHIYGSIDLSREFLQEQHDLGDVVLKPKQVLAFGQVADVMGKPIVGARVVLSQVGTRNYLDISMESYRQFFGNTATTGVDGSFVIYGTEAVDSAEIQVNKTGYPSVTDSWLGATVAHHLVLDAGFIIQGEVLLPGGLEEHGISLTYYPGTPAKKNNRDMKSAYGRKSGLFRMKDVPNELGFVQVGTGAGWPFLVLHTVENVQPWQPGEEGDPRFNPLDLRDALNLFHVTVQDESGKAVPGVKFATVFRRTNGISTRSIKSSDGRGSFLSADDSYEVHIIADGFRSVETVLRDPQTTITLHSALRTSFQLAWMPELPSLCSVVLSLKPVGGSKAPGLLENSMFDGSGVLLTNVSHPGQYEVLLGIHVNHGSSSIPLLDATGLPVIVNVRETDALQQFSLAAPPGFYDDLLMPDSIYDE